MSGSLTEWTNMFWLTLIVGIQFLGFGITLARLAYDEWQVWRSSRNAQNVDWGLLDPENAEVMSTDLDGKRAILAVHAMEVELALRHLSGSPAPATFSSIMDVRASPDSISDVTNDDEVPVPLIAERSARNLSREAA